MYRVDGIPIKACTFENKYSIAPNGMSQRGKGIYSYNSGFTVEKFNESIPNDTIYRSMFKQMDYGIYALNGRVTNPVIVDSCYFENNWREFILFS